MAMPFVPTLAWAIALSVISYPIYTWLSARISNQTIAAFVSVCLLAVLIVAPMILIFRELIKVLIENAEYMRGLIAKHGGADEMIISSLPRNFGRWLSQDLGIKKSLEDVSNQIIAGAPMLLTASIWTLVQLLLVFFTTFFFLRDKKVILSSIIKYLPLSTKECKQVFHDVDNTIHATIYGNFVTSAVQGFLGGLMFWILDIPGPVLWGFVMAVFSLIPTAGAFVVWTPAAIYLFLNGAWENSLILSVWGVFAVGLIDNILYPILVGQRVRLHTLPIFFAILGGVLFFGASGIVIGPVLLGAGQSLLKIAKDRQI